MLHNLKLPHLRLNRQALYYHGEQLGKVDHVLPICQQEGYYFHSVFEGKPILQQTSMEKVSSTVKRIRHPRLASNLENDFAVAPTM